MTAKPKPPKKEKDTPTGRRYFNGALKDVRNETLALGITEKTLWSRVTRGRIPYRKDHGRVVFLHDEVLEFFRRLPGVTVEQALENIAARQAEGAGR